MMRYIIFIFILSTNFALYSQDAVPLLPADTFAIHHALKNAEKYKKENNKKEESRYYDQIGLIYWEHNYFKKSVEFYEISRTLNEKLGNRSGMSMIDHNLGMIYADLREYDNSIVHFNKALNYRRTKKNKTGIITVLINMSVVLNNLARYEESIKKLNEALTLSRELNDMEQMKSCYGMLSETYEKAKQSDKAYYYFTLYRTFHEKLQEDKVIRIKKTVKEKELQLQLSEVEKRNGELELRLANKEIKQKDINISELDSTNKSLYTNLTQAELQKKLLEKDAQIKDNNLKTEIALKDKKQLQIKYLWFSIALIFIVLIVIAGLYRQKNKLNKIIKQRNKELETLSIAARETDNSIMIADSKGNIEWVNYRYSKNNGISLFEICEGNKNIYNLEKDNNGLLAIRNTVEKCESHIYDREVTLHNNDKVWIQTTVTPILDDDTKKIKRLVFIDSDISILKKSEQRINVQKLKIEKQANSLGASINYASLIQQAMLMKGNQLDNYFENSFVIYMPRDVVSGDFYWSTKVNEYIVIVEGDCTGHGVPGAFMSMIGMSLLNQIIDSESIVMPNLILERLNQGIRFALNQENNRNQDGMDASICTFDTKNKILYFSSANQVMIYFQKDKMHAIKGDRRFIGGTFNKKNSEFTLHEIKIDSEICFYLFSDGYQDQFGGKVNKKIGIKQLRKILTDNHKIKLEQQKQKFIDYINNWKNHSQQIDDITMLGIKINPET